MSRAPDPPPLNIKSPRSGKSKLRCDRCGRRIEKDEDGTLRATVSKFTGKRYCWRCPI